MNLALVEDKDSMDDKPTSYAALPVDLEIEMGLLGALLVHNRMFDQVADVVRPEHFASPLHGRIYEILSEQLSNGRAVDYLSLQNELALDDELEKAGGSKFLASLTSAAAAPSNAVEYARIVRDLHEKRCLIVIAEGATREAREGGVSSIDLIDKVSTDLDRLVQEGSRAAAVPTIPQQVDATLHGLMAAYKGDAPLGHPTKLADLDKMLVGKGLRPGCVYVLAGRSSMGKSALAVCIAEAVAHQAPVGYFSLEMGADEIHGRRLSRLTGIEYERLAEGKTSDVEAQQVIEMTGRIKPLPFYVDDTAGLVMPAIRRRAQSLKRRMKGLGLVVIDHLQLVRPEDTRENRNNQLALITSSVKAMAKELDCPVLLLSQLNRMVEQRDDKRPHMSDLRESGTIEENADAIMFIYRHAYYLERSKPAKNADKDTPEAFNERLAKYYAQLEDEKHVAELIFEKQRNGRTGTVKLYFNGPTMSFGNLDQQGEMV